MYKVALSFLVLGLGLISLINCSSRLSKPLQLEFIPISTYTYNDTIRHHKSESYLIKNYKKNESSNRQIDSFVCNRILSNYKNERDFTLIFYKESKLTNMENIKNNEKIIDRYSGLNDKIFTYKILNLKKEIVFKYLFNGDQLIESIKYNCNYQ